MTMMSIAWMAMMTMMRATARVPLLLYTVELVLVLMVQSGAACSGKGSCDPGQICAPTPHISSTPSTCMLPAVAADKAAMRTFRAAQSSSVSAEGGCLASWSDRIDPCEWEGVECFQLDDSGSRVVLLQLSNCGLVMTDSIGDLEELMFLEFDHNAADRVPPLAGLPWLRQLSMQANSIRELPASVGQLQSLSLLAMSDNLLENLPESLGDAIKLTKVHLDRNRLKRLPDSLGQLASLEQLLVKKNRLESVPDSLRDLRNLKILDLSENLIETLPQACDMDSLQEARLDGNKLKTVPDCFIGRALKTLQIARNRVSSLPSLRSDVLSLVDAQNNSIVSLPSTVPGTLSHLYLGANPLFIDPPRFSKWLQNASGLQHLDISLTSNVKYGPWFTTADGTCNRTFTFATRTISCTPRIEVTSPAKWSTAAGGMGCRIGQPCPFSIQIYDNEQIPLRTTLPDPMGINTISMRVRGGKDRGWQQLHDNRDGTYSATVPDAWLTAVASSKLQGDVRVFDDQVRIELRRGIGTAREAEFFTGMTTSDDRVCTDSEGFPDCPLGISVSPPDCARELGPFSRLNPSTNSTCECSEGYYMAGKRCLKQCSHNQQQVLVNGTVGCICMRGTYNTSAVKLSCTYGWPPITTPATEVCVPCPICAQCDSTVGGPPTVKAGWRESTATAGESVNYGSGSFVDIFVCPDQDEPIRSSCPSYVIGDPMPECAGNHTGVLCAACAAEYSAHGFDCVRCTQLTEISFGVPWTQVAIVAGVSCMSCIGFAMCLQKCAGIEANAERRMLKTAAKIMPTVLQMREVVWGNVRILLGMFQIVSMLQNTLDVTYPPVFSILCHWMGLASADSGSLLTLFQFDCYVDPGNAFLYAWIVKVFGVPMLMTLVILAKYCIDVRAEGEVEQDLSCDIGDKEFDKVATTKLKENVFNCVSLFYPWTSATIISALHCRQLGDGMSVLLHDYRVSCDTTTYSKLYWTACTMAVVVPIGVPVGLYVWMEIAIRQNMKTYAESQELEMADRDSRGIIRTSSRIDKNRLLTRLFWNPWPISVHAIDNEVDRDRIRDSSTTFDFSTYNHQRLQAMAFVLYEYKDGWVRYEPCDIVRKLILTSGLEMMWRGTSLQRLVACMIAAVFMCIQIQCKPYREPRSNLLKTAADANILLVIATSMLLHDQAMNPSTLGAVSPAEPYNRVPYGCILVGTTAAVAAAIIVESGNRIVHSWRINEKMQSGIDDREVALRLRVGGAFIVQDDEANVLPQQPLAREFTASSLVGAPMR